MKILKFVFPICILLKVQHVTNRLLKTKSKLTEEERQLLVLGRQLLGPSYIPRLEEKKAATPTSSQVRNFVPSLIKTITAISLLRSGMRPRAWPSFLLFFKKFSADDISTLVIFFPFNLGLHQKLNILQYV